MTIAVITGLYGQYDTLREPVEQTVDCEWVCVTDDPTLRSDTWRIKLEPRPSKVHPRLAAKHPKFKPWRFTTADRSIWLDASAEIRSPKFAEELMNQLGDADLAQWKHPWRDCIFEEANASEGMLKYQGLPIQEQVKTYRKAGHPEHWGLWATGLIVRQHSQLMRELGMRWLFECQSWTYQDQLSEPYLLRKYELRPVELTESLDANPWLGWHHHASGL